jgi:hypothetical protein
VQVGRERRGHVALRANLDAQLRAIGISILFVGNHVIDFESDDRATGIVYCRAEIQDGGRWIQQAIRYDDLYERTAEGWRFVRRRHLLFYGADLGDNPLHLGTADWPQHHTGRGTLPESLETWQAFWGEDAPAPGDGARGRAPGEGEESRD